MRVKTIIDSIPAMSDRSLRPLPISVNHSQTPQDEAPSLRSVLPTDYHDLSPLDALAAQGRLLNKRLKQHRKKSSSSTTSSDSPPPSTKRGLDDSLFPKFGVSDTLEDHVHQGNPRRHRIPEKRRERDFEKSQRSPIDSLPLGTLSLQPVPFAPIDDPVNFTCPESQASSQLNYSASSDGSCTPTESQLNTQPPPKIDPPKLRPIIKTQHLNRPNSPSYTPIRSNDQIVLTENPSATSSSFSPQLSNTLDRPRLPSLHTKSGGPPSINFSRPFSSRSSAYSDASSMHEVDFFSPQQKVSPSSDDHLSVPIRSPGTESIASSPGLGEEDLKKLPRGRRKLRPIDTSVFFPSTNLRSRDSAYRWPQTPATPAGDGEKKFFPSPESQSGRSTRSTSTSDIPPLPRPSTSGSIVETQRLQINRSRSHEDRPSLSRSKSQESPKPKYTLQPPPSPGIFDSPPQVLNMSRKATKSLLPVPAAEPISPEDHVNLGIKFHQQNLLPQSTHHFHIAAEHGSPTGMLLYSLSLRHGWGCAANPEKAVEWLQSAAECASAEVDEKGARRGKGNGLLKSEDDQSGGATLALAIYELGQSYMHGWGVQKDKSLALRCYELSANFGDTDGQWYSLPHPRTFTYDSETAWCYLHGIGTKKNAKMAARYYRMAEKQGVKSVGLSWIWKEKYNENEAELLMKRAATDEDKSSKKGKKLFGRKNTA